MKEDLSGNNEVNPEEGANTEMQTVLHHRQVPPGWFWVNENAYRHADCLFDGETLEIAIYADFESALYCERIHVQDYPVELAFRICDGNIIWLYFAFDTAPWSVCRVETERYEKTSDDSAVKLSASFWIEGIEEASKDHDLPLGFSRALREAANRSKQVASAVVPDICAGDIIECADALCVFPDFEEHLGETNVYLPTNDKT